jgi:serine/threonine protein kinase/formylglycine-generating enzyme required for sulfatase activity
MTEPNLPKRSIGNPDPAATSDHIDSGDQTPKELDTLGDLNATNETSSSKNPKAEASNTNREVLLGRFRVQKVLGEGAFGKVYLAKDEQLNRLVAIKISKEIILDKNVLDSFLSEAQMLAKLDHPNIVPVHDVGNSATEGFFIISKYLDGGTLSKALTTNASDITWVCRTIALIADGLHHAHTRGLVHRDIKPDNILLDASGSPCIVDFGLALKEESFGQGKGLMGTPLYMSPEQAGGEGHRVDGRSDIFSLGVILYEMLAGRRPFEAKTVMMLLQMIKMVEVKPLRQINSKIDKELERICLKALSRKLLDRYATAADMAADLRSFLASGFMPSGNLQYAPSINIEGNKSGSKSGNISGLNSKNIQVVYKGLRSFDQSDAGFFLELLPGSRDRDGLPASIRFWKTQIENPSSSFSVGVIYGPSGCGKSSLMKAGLIPNLDGKIIPIYLEATTITTEESILKQLRKRLPDLPQELTLVEAFALIRKKKPAGLNRKLLLIVDQFEQWLSANPNIDNAPLVQALRQVDGDYFQVILMIRDDFILAMNRLMAVLEIPILEGVNFSLVDLFEQKHSRKVLRLFGKALECLPEGELSKEQQQFIHKSIESLSVDGKVISVRLSVFADMMKSRPWLIESLNSIGGVEGVGVQFLEETFFSSGAPALCKIHHKAAQKVLRALLPSSGSSIKGGMLSLEGLKEVSTYANKPRDFEQLLQLLDSDLRLITPTTQEDDSDSKRFYQLAHDYLVPSLQEWLLRKQKETRKGRAELVLEDRSKVWNLNPENRQLPSLIQCLSIHWNVPSKDWTKPQRKMIKKASKYYLVRSILVACMLLMLGFLGWEGYLQRDRANKNEELAQVGLGEIKKAEEYNLKVIQIADKLEMVLIHAGKFTMGSKGRLTDENEHEVTLTKSFYMGMYEVTQEQWEGVMRSNPSRTKAADLPVTNVSWEDCQEFIEKLNKNTYRSYRLPTEAEWEYACRAGTTTAYSFGDSLTKSDANIESSSIKTVGSYRPNAFGLYDMHGNVFEWCEDWYGPSYQLGTVTDPKGPATGESRVLRGGSFLSRGSSARSFDRYGSTPTNRVSGNGFRLARTK